MGWLKPAESLLEPKGIWDAHRDAAPDGPVPEPAEGIVAAGQTVHGVRIGAAGAVKINEIDLERRKGMDCVDEQMVVDNSFDWVPVALLLGVPLMFKRIFDDEKIATIITLSFAIEGRDEKLLDSWGLKSALREHFAADDIAFFAESGRFITADAKLIFKSPAAAKAAFEELQKIDPATINGWTEVTSLPSPPVIIGCKPPSLETEELRYETKMYAYKLMTTPGLGLPLTWNQNGTGTRLPPILACRSDGLPFTSDDWMCLCEFQEYLDENYVAKEHLWYTNKVEFKKWAEIYVRGRCYGKENTVVSAFPEIAPCFEFRFPLGLKVQATGLSAKPELNGLTGVVTKYDEPKLRIGVQFPPPYGLLALKHTNIEHVPGGAAERSKMLLDKIDSKNRKSKS
mmetsp:Transcript_11220/g.22683  ORF Transcript_11220/g.22683 Transcript_11220/m.22683 type:complete len:399 (-) Transcript_11220:418-1614(-)